MPRLLLLCSASGFELIPTDLQDLACWDATWTARVCCNPMFGAEGHAACWGGGLSFARCCGYDPATIRPASERAGPLLRVGADPFSAWVEYTALRPASLAAVCEAVAAAADRQPRLEAMLGQWTVGLYTLGYVRNLVDEDESAFTHFVHKFLLACNISRCAIPGAVQARRGRAD